MDIDFNNVRVQALHAYNRLVRTLNAGIDPERGSGNVVEVYADDIEDPLNDLRQMIGAIACTFKKDDDDFKMVYTDDITLECFNEAE